MAEIKIVLDASQIAEALSKVLEPGCVLMPHEAVCRLLDSHDVGEDDLVSVGGIKSANAYGGEKVIDYKALLKKYMRLIRDEEGSTFLGSIGNSSNDVWFTQEEVAELNAIRGEIRDE